MSKIKINPEKIQDHKIKISYDRKLKDETSYAIDYLNCGGFLYISETIYMKMMLNFYAETILTWTEVGKAFQPIKTTHDRYLHSEKTRKNYTTNYIYISPELNTKINKAIMHLQSLIMNDHDLRKYKNKILNSVTLGNFAREGLRYYNNWIRCNKCGDAFMPGKKV